MPTGREAKQENDRRYLPTMNMTKKIFNDQQFCASGDPNAIAARKR
jgi:hypothetical protein